MGVAHSFTDENNSTPEETEEFSILDLYINSDRMEPTTPTRRQLLLQTCRKYKNTCRLNRAIEGFNICLGVCYVFVNIGLDTGLFNLSILSKS